jgi:hypothetical protein
LKIVIAGVFGEHDSYRREPSIVHIMSVVLVALVPKPLVALASDRVVCENLIRNEMVWGPGTPIEASAIRDNEPAPQNLVGAANSSSFHVFGTIFDQFI